MEYIFCLIDRLNLIDIDAELKLSFLGGLIEVSNYISVGRYYHSI